MTNWHPGAGQDVSGEQPQLPPPPQYGGSLPPPGYLYPAPPPGNGLAVAGLVLGIIGLLVFGVVLGPLATIFGGVGLSRANKGASGKGLAIAGLTLGIIDTVLALVLLIVLSSGGAVL